MEAAARVRSSLPRILLQVGQLSVMLSASPKDPPVFNTFCAGAAGMPWTTPILAYYCGCWDPHSALEQDTLLIQHRMYLYHFLLLKIAVFQQWVLGLAQEAQGSGSNQAHGLPGVIITYSLSLALRAGLALLWVPLWLLLWGPRLAYKVGLCCTRTMRLALGHRGAWEPLGLSAATVRDLFISCLHSLMLVALLMLLLTWRLVQKAHHFSLGWLPSQNSVLLEALALLRRLYLWVEHSTTLTSWNLAYLVTWITCLISHLLQAAFEHTAQLAQAQEAKSQETLGPPSPQFLIPESSTTEVGALPSQPGTPGE